MSDTNRLQFEIRGSLEPPTCPPGLKTYSVSIGQQVEVGHKPAAWYRVVASVNDDVRLARTANHLLAWLNRHANDPCGDRAPAECVEGGYHSVRIRVTRAGRAAGFYAPGGPRRTS